MSQIDPTPFWIGISVMYFLLSISVSTTWWKIRTLHKKSDSHTFITRNGLTSGGINMGGSDGPRINVEKMFLSLVTANLIGLLISFTGSILTIV